MRTIIILWFQLKFTDLVIVVPIKRRFSFGELLGLFLRMNRSCQNWSQSQLNLFFRMSNKAMHLSKQTDGRRKCSRLRDTKWKSKTNDFVIERLLIVRSFGLCVIGSQVTWNWVTSPDEGWVRQSRSSSSPSRDKKRWGWQLKSVVWPAVEAGCVLATTNRSLSDTGSGQPFLLGTKLTTYQNLQFYHGFCRMAT